MLYSALPSMLRSDRSLLFFPPAASQQGVVLGKATIASNPGCFGHPFWVLFPLSSLLRHVNLNQCSALKGNKAPFGFTLDASIHSILIHSDHSIDQIWFNLQFYYFMLAQCSTRERGYVMNMYTSNITYSSAPFPSCPRVGSWACPHGHVTHWPISAVTP